MKMKNKILLFLKGILMGVCDLIPGISGGTIAFITGIYEQLINSVKNITSFKIKKQDVFFLINLGLGIFIAILFGSRIIKFLLENFSAYTLAFFVGLILASCKIIFDNIKNHSLKNIFVSFIGFVIGLIFAVVSPMDITPNFIYLFFGGFFAISAMFLPGISGAFILLIMGIYGFMIDNLHNPLENLNYIAVFALGAIFGAIFISRLISFLFKKDKCKTLYFLLGLVVGSLGIPVRRIISSISLLQQAIISLFFILAGILIVLFLQAKSRRIFYSSNKTH